MPEYKIEMRVIAGMYRHRKITWPSDSSIRPTKDRIKEAIFSAIGDVEGKYFLDLYAGSGAIGIEALSRGASHCVFVDNNPNAIKTVKLNLETLGISRESYSVFGGSDFEMLSNLTLNKDVFDIIFIDPPYEKGEYEKIIDFIILNNLISEKGIIILESNKEIIIDYDFSKIKKYKYGEIFVKILWR